jgi:hypothetical protein
MRRKIEKIVWNFAEWCLNIPLLEMASERNYKLSKIESKNNTINEHIFKYYLMPNSRDRNHWLCEIDDRLNEVQDLVWSKNRRFRSDEYFDIFYNRFYTKDYSNINYKKIERIFSKIELEYKTEYQKDYDINDFIEKVAILLNELSNLLESGDYDKNELLEKVKILK